MSLISLPLTEGNNFIQLPSYFKEYKSEKIIDSVEGFDDCNNYDRFLVSELTDGGGSCGFAGH